MQKNAESTKVNKLTAKQLKKLLLFKQKICQLQKVSIVKDGFNVGVDFKYKQEQGLEIKGRFPNEDSVKSLLMSLRFFLNNDEPLFFYKICNILYLGTNGEIRKEAAQIRKIFSDILHNPPINFVENGKTLSPEKIINLWINGEYFHVDEEKAQTLFDLYNSMGDFIKYLLLDPLVQIVKLLIYTDRFIDKNFDFE